jgi:hypothetical protein
VIVLSHVRPSIYPLTIEAHPEDGGYLAYFPTLPGCQTWGETYEAAAPNVEEAASGPGPQERPALDKLFR